MKELYLENTCVFWLSDIFLDKFNNSINENLCCSYMIKHENLCYLWENMRTYVIYDKTWELVLSMTKHENLCYLWENMKTYVICDKTWELVLYMIKHENLCYIW